MIPGRAVVDDASDDELEEAGPFLGEERLPADPGLRTPEVTASGSPA